MNLSSFSCVFLALCVAFFAASQAQSVSQPSDCYSITDADVCIATNNARPINNSAVHCLWCHSHGKGGKSRSHCAPHVHIKANGDYHQGNWVCDYRIPNTKHFLEGKHGRYHGPNGTHINNRNHTRNHHAGGRHGRHLLDDGSNQITQFIENEVSGWSPAAQMIAGIVYGSLGNLPTDLNNCLNNAEHLYGDVETTFNNWQWEFSVSVMLPELEELFTDVQDVLNTIKACNPVLTDASSEVRAVLKIVQGASGPIGWLIEAGEVAWHSVNVYQDINAAIDNFNNQNYFDSGYNIGAIIYILIQS